MVAKPNIPTKPHAVPRCSQNAEQKLYAQYNQDPDYNECLRCRVLVQPAGKGLADLVVDAVRALKPDVLVMGSQGLCE
jgi:hypothetical protein